MQSRLNYNGSAAYRAMLALEESVSQTGLEPELLELVKLRASQINGCAFCIDMHSHDLQKRGTSDQRIWLVAAWREACVYSDRERAALAWTEAVTLVSEDQVPDPIFEFTRKHFTEEELIELNLAVVAINAWNRFAIPFRKPVLPRS